MNTPSDRSALELLRETVVRCNLCMPETEEQMKWFDEGVSVDKSGDFFERIFKTLDLGNLEKDCAVLSPSSIETTEQALLDLAANIIEDCNRYMGANLVNGEIKEFFRRYEEFKSLTTKPKEQ